MLCDYVLSLQLASGGYRSHVNYGFVPGKTTLAYEVDPWRSTITATALLRSNYRPDLAVPSALRAARFFLANRQLDGGPPDKQWVNASGVVIARTGVDAQDSADAAFLQLCCELRRAAPNDARVMAVFNVAYDLVKLADNDGLFWTFNPTSGRPYKAKLLAGNAEDISALWRFSTEIAGTYYRDAAQSNYYFGFSARGQAAIQRELVGTTAGGVKILKGETGLYQPLSTTPNWDQWDKYPAIYLINQGIVARNSPLAQNLIAWLNLRHPNWTSVKPVTALTRDAEIGITLVLVGEQNGAVVFTRTILDNVFDGTGKPTDGRFNVNDVAALLQVTAMTGRTR
jgi:hypothetical protein